MNKVEILEGAKRVIQDRGWTQDVLVDPDAGRVCTIGALNVVVLGRPDEDLADYADPTPESDYLAVREVARFITSVIPEEQIPRYRDEEWNEETQTYEDVDVLLDDFDVPDWNDDPKRTVEDVLAVLDLAIAKASTVAEDSARVA